jgi:preprotein translocase subunit SecD
MAKNRRKRPWSLIIIVTVAVLALAYTIFTTNRPFLGLDLQGGVSVVLAPPANQKVNSGSLNEAIDIINNRINSLGVAEAQVTRQGNDINVEIPGVKDKDRALQLVGETAELQFRPVLATVPVGPDGTVQTGGTTPASTASPSTTAAGATPAPAGATTTAPSTTAAPSTTTKKSLGVTGTGEQAGGTQPVDTVDELAAAATTTTAAPTTTAAAGATATTAKGATTTTAKPTSTSAESLLTPESELQKPGSRTQQVVLPQRDPKTKKIVAIFELGPTVVTGSGLSGASSDLNTTGQWEVRPVFKDGKNGIDLFNAAASTCFTGASGSTCPAQQGNSHGQIAVVLDNNVLTAPTINNPTFQRDQITISGNFTQSSASDVATALRYGALPVVLKPQTSQIVSATLGKDALHAGLVAGVVGFILVGLYMIGFYRILGVLAMIKLGIEGCIMWGFLCWAGPHLGLALTLAGITGIIVSIGVSLDSNVVYYEHLKEDVRSGRTIRASVDKSFASAWSTILAADGASVLGAALLYYLTVGAVRGFAFYLGLSTVLDLITSYCYMRPAVARATRSKMCQTHPHRFGLPSPDDIETSAQRTRELVTSGAR